MGANTINQVSFIRTIPSAPESHRNRLSLTDSSLLRITAGGDSHPAPKPILLYSS